MGLWGEDLPEAGARPPVTVAVVTGAPSDMGREGVLVAFDLEAPSIEGAVGVACDVSDPAAVLALAAQVRGTPRTSRAAHLRAQSRTQGYASGT